MSTNTTYPYRPLVAKMQVFGPQNQHGSTDQQSGPQNQPDEEVNIDENF